MCSNNPTAAYVLIGCIRTLHWRFVHPLPSSHTVEDLGHMEYDAIISISDLAPSAPTKITQGSHHIHVNDVETRKKNETNAKKRANIETSRRMYNQYKIITYSAR